MLVDTGKQEITMADYDWDKVRKNKPTNPLCEKAITVDIVGTRCVYLNDHRIAGGKPYVSENLPWRSMGLSVREALAAFSIAELEAYIAEKKERDEYHKKHRALAAA